MFQRKHHRKTLEEMLMENFIDPKRDLFSDKAKALQSASLKLLKANLPGRVFNDFEPSLIMDPVTYKKLSEKFLKILPKQKNVIDDEKRGGYSFGRDQDRDVVLEWLDYIMKVGCHDLLDGKGKIKKGIVNLMAWTGEKIAMPEAIITSFVECIVRDILTKASLKKPELTMDKSYLVVNMFINRDFKEIAKTQLNELIELQKMKNEFDQRAYVLSKLLWLRQTETEEAIFNTLLSSKESTLFLDLERAYEECLKAGLEEEQFTKLIGQFKDKYKPDLTVSVDSSIPVKKSPSESKSLTSPESESDESLSMGTPSESESSLSLSTPRTPASIQESPGGLRSTAEVVSPVRPAEIENVEAKTPTPKTEQKTAEVSPPVMRRSPPPTPSDDQRDTVAEPDIQPEPVVREKKEVTTHQEGNHTHQHHHHHHHAHHRGAGASHADVKHDKTINKESFFDKARKAKEALTKFMTAVPTQHSKYRKKR